MKGNEENILVLEYREQCPDAGLSLLVSLALSYRNSGLYTSFKYSCYTE